MVCNSAFSCIIVNHPTCFQCIIVYHMCNLPFSFVFSAINISSPSSILFLCHLESMQVCCDIPTSTHSALPECFFQQNAVYTGKLNLQAVCVRHPEIVNMLGNQKTAIVKAILKCPSYSKPLNTESLDVLHRIKGGIKRLLYLTSTFTSALQVQCSFWCLTLNKLQNRKL